MPLENLQTLQDLEITGPAGSQQDGSQYETIESDEQAARPLQPDHASALHQASQAHPFGQPHTAPFYPPLLNPFGFDSTSTIPIDPGFLDARFDHPAAPGPGGGGVPGFHRDPWAAQPATSVNMDSFMVAPTSLPQHNPSMPLVPGMSSFEPMVSTAWSMDGSLPSTSTSRGPTMSASLSVPGTSTPTSSQSPSSPRKVSAGMVEPSAANGEAVPIHLAVQVEPGLEDQPNKKRRQPSGPKAPPKTIAEKRGHRNNPSAGFSNPQIPIAPAPAPAAVATTSDDNKTNDGIRTDTGNNSSSASSKHRKTSSATTATTSYAPTSQPALLRAAQEQHQQQQQQPQPQPDPRARNREAANRCRAKSKVAAAELEATERAMGAEHEALTRTARSLREEVLSLKNQLLMHGNCDDDLIQQYLANSARLVGSGVLGPAVVAAGAGGAGAGGPAMMPTVPGPPLVAGPPGIGRGGGVSSSGAMHPAPPPPGVLPVVLPPSSASGAGTAAARGHQQRGGAQRH